MDLEINPARGTVHRQYYRCGLDKASFGLWLNTCCTWSVAYYIIPAITGRAIDKYYLADLWLLVHRITLAPWSVVHHLEGGPVPMWIPAIGTVMSIAMIFPIAVASTNFHATAIQGYRAKYGIVYLPLRFVIFGTLSYTISSYIGVVFLACQPWLKSLNFLL